MKRRILIVIDMQNDFISGVLGTKEAVQTVPKVCKKIREYRDRGDKIFLTKDTHYGDYMSSHEGKYLPIPHCVSGSNGWRINADVAKAACIDPESGEIYENSMVLTKSGFGYDRWYASLLSYNRDKELFEPVVDEIEVVGLTTNICVVSNVLILRSMLPEVEIVVDASCCAGTTPEAHHAAIEVMRSCHIRIMEEDC